MLLSFLRDLSARHAALKARIHGTRIPLSPAGQRAMGVVYFSIPLVVGYATMRWTESIARANLGEHGERLVEHRRRWEDEGKARVTQKRD